MLLPEEQYAIEARLNLTLGAVDYDSVFLGFSVEELANDGILHVCARNEWCAGLIEARYSYELAIAAEAELRKPVSFVNVLPRELRIPSV